MRKIIDQTQRQFLAMLLGWTNGPDKIFEVKKKPKVSQEAQARIRQDSWARVKGKRQRQAS
jgi:hypothetical protein